MTPRETAQSYDNLASHWNCDKFNRENGISQHKRALRFSKVKESAIDIGCGSSGRIIELLLSEGFEVEGLDISPEMIRLAKERNPQQVFHQADICEWNFPKRYDFISAWDSIWHAPLEEHEAILKKLCDALEEDGILIFTSGGVDAPQDGSNPFLGQPLYHAALGIPKLLEIVGQNGCVCRHLEYDQQSKQGDHLYLIIQKVDQGGASNG
ncbi:class I SAM-dependent methyltransferase [Cerasicoccus arenae]|uniref:class I SAM-dependent methyltransferase n=1 Tax=Cerasicoccus arenae TaxID=424488 RepID=UPI001676EAD1|nr:class I SAM-dependent methyltransferase [Cerasicoccus arenae]MBK1860080.1 class I SAM-dependent methyltransferase [Cerasicoccus arenae]